MEEYINQAERLSFSEYRIFYWELLARLRYPVTRAKENVIYKQLNVNMAAVIITSI